MLLNNGVRRILKSLSVGPILVQLRASCGALASVCTTVSDSGAVSRKLVPIEGFRPKLRVDAGASHRRHPYRTDQDKPWLCGGIAPRDRREAHAATALWKRSARLPASARVLEGLRAVF